MLYIGIILAMMYACLSVFIKLEMKEELRKAKEEGYDVSFSI